MVIALPIALAVLEFRARLETRPLCESAERPVIQYAMAVVPLSLAEYVNESSAKRRELAALLEQGYAIVSVTNTNSSEIALAFVVTLQVPIRERAVDQ